MSAFSKDRPPPVISLDNNLLATTISLPNSPTIHYLRFTQLQHPPPPSPTTTTDAFEAARRYILTSNASLSPVDSLLVSLRIDSECSFMFVFCIASGPDHDQLPSVWHTLSFDGLEITERSSFTPHSPLALSPEPDKRRAYSYFLDAVRSRIIDDIVIASTNSQTARHLKRFKHGFLMSQPTSSSDWEYKSIVRPLVFCHLQIHFVYDTNESPTQLIVHPILLSTPLLDLQPSLPLPPGTPVLLLPYGTPAYYLSSYTGPTTALIKQFSASLQGLGASSWHNSSSDSNPRSTLSHSPTFIIAWIKVENKQGEDKGTTIIYPTSLCLSYMPLSSSRPPLDCIPDLPAPLQPSPQVPPAAPSVSALSQFDLLQPHKPSLDPVSTVRRPSIFSSPTSESLFSFRTLTLSKTNDLRQVATEIGGYVDSVARERERERERLKREREGGPSASPRLARAIANTPASSFPTPMVIDTATPSLPPYQPPPPALPPSIPQTAAPQSFYPSPPQIPPTATSTDVKTSPVVETALPFPSDDGMATDPPQSSPLAGPSAPPPPSATSSSTARYDPFGDSSWAQSAENYLGMGMDFGMDDMNFGMNVANSGAGGIAFNEARSAMDFDNDFTDDDFSFFDRPSRPSALQASTSLPNTHSRVTSTSSTYHLASSVLPLGTVMSPGMFDDLNLHGSAPHTQQLFTPGALIDSFTPHSADHHESIHAELLPSSPGPTPETHSAPATPGVQLEYDPAARRPSTGSSFPPSTFEPIPFASVHRAADDKYAVGKFAFQLPSPPADDYPEIFHPQPNPASPGPSTTSWRMRYNAVTDPRYGLVRKLIGVKRKTPVQGTRDPPKKPPWFDAPEEWESTTTTTKVDEEDTKSDAESEDEDDEVDDLDSPLMSRPTTPPPSYLPLGPTLLHAQFQHAQLLPISVPLRPPGSAVAPINLTNSSPPSVPTPVSPAAMLGAASERSKSLEAAANAIASEVVENPLWAQVWRAISAGARSTASVWPTDVKAVAHLFELVPYLKTKLDLGALFGLEASTPMQPLEAPTISVGKSDAIIQISPTALRFWEKLGLGPKSGQKDLSVFVLFEDDGEARQCQVESWLERLSNVYQGKHFGTIFSGKSSACSKDGLVPVRLDSTFRKSFNSFISNLGSQQRPVVVFLVLPVSIMTLSSPVLRQIISLSKKAMSHEDYSIVFDFIPEQFIIGPLKSLPYDSALDVCSSSIYNRVLVPVDRQISRRIHTHEEPVRTYLMAPSLTLARPIYNKVSYVRNQFASLDVIDRFTLLHIGYHVSACGKWILACCVDQRGESYDTGVWLTQLPGEHDGEIDLTEEEYIVRKVWEFGYTFGKKANVEWRIVVSRLGVMSQREIDAWNNHLSVHILTSPEHPPLHATIVCVEPDTSWSFLAPTKPTAPQPTTQSSRSPPHRSSSYSSRTPTVFTDVSTITYAIYPNTRIPISVAPSQADLGLAQAFIPEPISTNPSLPSSPKHTNPVDTLSIDLTKDVPSSPPMSFPVDPPPEYEPHAITFLPQFTSILTHVPISGSPTSITMTHIYMLKTYHSQSYTESLQAFSNSAAVIPTDDQLRFDITNNFHELAILSRLRWKLGVGLSGNNSSGPHPHLPFHLAAVDAMRLALDRDWERLETSGDA